MGLFEAVERVDLRLESASGPAQPPPGSEHRAQGAMLKAHHVTQRIRMELHYTGGQRRTIGLHYVNRGMCRDVYGTLQEGSSLPPMAVKLQQWSYHQGSNMKEAECISIWSERLPHSLPVVIWCGKASLEDKWGGTVELSALVVGQEGEDLMCRLQRLRTMQLLDASLSVFRAFLNLYLDSWGRGVHLGDYGLRQVCVRFGVRDTQQLSKDDLVLVDVEGLVPTGQASGKLGKPWNYVWKELEASLAERNVIVPPAAMNELATLIDGSTLRWYRETIAGKFEQIVQQLAPATSVRATASSSTQASSWTWGSGAAAPAAVSMPPVVPTHAVAGSSVWDTPPEDHAQPWAGWPPVGGKRTEPGPQPATVLSSPSDAFPVGVGLSQEAIPFTFADGLSAGSVDAGVFHQAQPATVEADGGGAIIMFVVPLFAVLVVYT